MTTPPARISNSDNALLSFQEPNTNQPLQNQKVCEEVIMSDPNSYDVYDLVRVVNMACDKFKGFLLYNPDYFGNAQDTAARVKFTLERSDEVVEPHVLPSIDATTEAGIMKTVDLTILDRNATYESVEKVAERAAKVHSATVCVYPEHIYIVKEVMNRMVVMNRMYANVPPIAVVGFPAVAAPTSEETAETLKQTSFAISEGAKEIDMVLPTSFREIGPNADSSAYLPHFEYIKTIVDEAHKSGVPVKVILETAYLNDRQIAEACILSVIAGADWVKTSTGFAEADKLAAGKNLAEHKGATPHDVALMRLTVDYSSLDDEGNPKRMGVKASGGIRDRKQAVAVLEAGADRIGASSGINVSDDSIVKTTGAY